MSQYVAPILVLNLGSEMIFVIAQRLQAQNIPHERATLVLEEIISVLISKPLIVDLMKPQTTHDHNSVRAIIEDVTQSSAMRLDPISMGKLWDLITMVFKWQVSMSDNLIGITLRHLYEIESYIINPDTHQQLLRVQNLVENFNKILDQKEKTALHEDVLFWLKNYNVRVSLLLRMGLQNMDGNFVVNNLDPIAEEMLRNLGK
ncbi:protein OSCP1-like [Anoplophora glabripennis]|uniref:protein OSCP1-like n=1 Tax=Anoplophora glabripennis TaxID=217634 RepID=UPI000C768324|nr:protein OSCP1-like [Anoplophora glabripennis]